MHTMLEKETETTPVEVDAEETEDTEPVEAVATEAPSEESEQSEEPQTVDYKAIAEEERQRREKAEKALADKAFRLREEKREEKQEDTEPSDDDDRPLTRKEFLAMMQEREQETAKTSQLDEVKRIIAQNTSSEDEAEAALLMYQNRVVPTGDPVADALFAIGGLNVNRSKAITEELKRSVKAKQNVTTYANQHTPDPSQVSEPKISSLDAQAIKAAGMVWDGKKRLYTKAVGKRTMFFDPKKPQGQKQWIV